MKKHLVLPLALLTLAAACSDANRNPFSPENAAADAKIRLQNGGGSVASAATVAGQFEVEIGGGAGAIVESGVGINEEGKEHGTCHAGGQWRNPSGQYAQTIPHPHCIQGGGGTVTWNFSAPANFVNNGQNILLNFEDLVDYFVHYHGAQNRSSGEGIFTANLGGGTWTLDLNQYDLNNTNVFVSCATGLCLNASVSFSLGGDVYQTTALLSW